MPCKHDISLLVKCQWCEMEKRAEAAERPSAVKCPDCGAHLKLELNGTGVEVKFVKHGV